jgi:hypothetical protein
LDPRAFDALKNNQRQLDMDGVEVGVSRQALDELIAAYETDAPLSQPQAGEPMLTPEEEAAIVEDINSGRWPYLQPSSGDGIPVRSPQPANPAQVTDAAMWRVFLRAEDDERAFTFTSKTDMNAFLKALRAAPNGWSVTDIHEYRASTPQSAIETLGGPVND